MLVDLRELKGEALEIERFFYLQFLGELHDMYVGVGLQALNVAYVGSSRFVSGDGFEERVAEKYNYKIKTTATMDEGLQWLEGHRISK